MHGTRSRTSPSRRPPRRTALSRSSQALPLPLARMSRRVVATAALAPVDRWVGVSVRALVFDDWIGFADFAFSHRGLAQPVSVSVTQHPTKVSDVGRILGESLNRLEPSALDDETRPTPRLEFRDLCGRQRSRWWDRTRHRDNPKARLVEHWAKGSTRRNGAATVMGSDYRSVLNPARSSATKSAGCSHAAKCP